VIVARLTSRHFLQTHGMAKSMTSGGSGPAGCDRYKQRKLDELRLIEAALAKPPSPPRTRRLSTLLKRKFRSAAMCRSQMAAEHWSQTETNWRSGPCGSGAFRFDYDYQRADLHVEGPPVYPVRGLPPVLPAQFTTSGMAAISAVLLALRELWPRCSFDVRADGYPETGELIALLAHGGSGSVPTRRVVVLDSTVDTPKSAAARLDGGDVAVFDTSCFAASSGRIARIANAARERHVPLILARSHTKLDCFGLDYGRLGSVVVVAGKPNGSEGAIHQLVGDFIRLTGSAALPLHFPPFAAGESYHSLTRDRVTWMIRSTRVVEKHLREAAVRSRPFTHGLYVCVFPQLYPDRDAASDAAAALIARFVAAGIPARHAGSFGFDFFGCDWFEDPADGTIGLRLSTGDLPISLVERAGATLVSWCREESKHTDNGTGAS
jgi:hypothetical protein